ncbi:MAG: sigma-54-dependent Fis family transcriptional regulator [Planctomycetia bacterium]|nr:sigma-54-dependent Fis family transcriptional regulator [Planctomycetia bacterium]
MSTGCDERRTAGSRWRFVGNSVHSINLRRRAALYAPEVLPVLIVGETGTGKELIAQDLHDQSPRRRGPFVAVNCGALPGGLLLSELFGHKRGAFTGALTDHKGAFERASGGTLFLDEVGEAPSDVQGALLRATEDPWILPVGAERPIRVDVRIVAATNRDLEAMPTFRPDLLARLGMLRLDIAPLRSRAADLPAIVDSILAQFGLRADESVLEVLRGYEWPGNVRELQAILHRTRIHSRVVTGETVGRELAACRPHRPVPRSLEDGLDAVRREAAIGALRESRGTFAEAACALGISEPGLRKIVKRLEIEASAWEVEREV